MKRLLVVVLLAVSCGGQSKADREASADIVGTPPTPAEDPFFYVARPPVDAKADRQGTIGDVEAPERNREPDKVVEKSKPIPKIEKSGLSKAERERLEKLEVAAKAAQREAEAARAELEQVQRENTLALARQEEAEARAIELRAKNVQLEGELEDARRRAKKAESQPKSTVTKSDLAQCHACVKLCPMKGKCADDAELVCGWGAGKTRKSARQRATSECDGALQSMRESGAFSRIAGTCPVATCLK